MNHEWTRMDTNECSSGFPARVLPSATGCLKLAAARRGFAVCWSHAKPRRREGNPGGILNHEWTRMDTNECSSGFPARDLPSATGCLRTAAAGRGACRPWASREDAKTRRKRRGDGEPRMDTNERSSGFPARDLPSATGCLQIASAGGEGRRWPHAKTRRETQRWVFGLRSG